MRAILYRFSTYAKLVENIQKRGLPKGVDFETNVKPALTVYESLGFHPQVVSRIYKERPLSIVQDGKHTDIGQLNQLLKARLGIDDKSLRSIVFKDPQILGKSLEELNKNFDIMQQTLAISVSDTASILKAYPLLMRNFEANYQSFKKVFDTYAHFTEQQFGQLLVNTPYLFAFNLERLAPNFKMMYYRQFTTKEIQELLLKTADFLDLKPKQFEKLYNHYDVLITDKRLLHQFLIDNHKLMLLDPPFMIGTKINLFKNMKLSLTQIGQCLQVCPAVFQKSVQSLQLKLKFFEKHFKIQIAKEPCFPTIFQFDYWTVIRPRLVIANTVENAVEICRMNEEDFIQKYNCAEKYKELINEVPKDLPKEVDFVIKKYHRFCHDKIELLK